MMKRAGAHLRSNLVAYLALFVAMGGTAYAAATVGSAEIIDESILSADIKNGEVRNADIAVDAVTSTRIPNLGIRNPDLGANSVTTSKVANDGLTGADILESSLGQVPNADKVDGLNAALINHQTSGTTASPVEVLNLGGLILRLECVNSDFFEPRLVAATTVADAVIRSRTLPDFAGTDEVGRITDDDFDNVAVDEKTLYDASQGSGLINYRTPAGSNVTVQYMVEGIGTSVGGCSVSGTAFQGVG